MPATSKHPAGTTILVDGREFVAGLRTGIGRFLEGLLLAMSDAHADWTLRIALDDGCSLPESLQDRLNVLPVPCCVGLRWHRMSAGCDLFISPYPKLPFPVLPCPAIHTVHDVLYLTHPAYHSGDIRSRLSLFRLRHAVRTARLSWFVSRASLDECEALLGQPVPHPAVRHNAVEEAFSPGRERMQEEPYFLYVGNGLPHKNLDVLLRTLPSVDARLVCVGVKGERIAHYRGCFPDMGDRIDFRRQVDDAGLVSLYRGAVALVFPSTAEGFGYPPLEAMACGTPAIVSDIPVLRESAGKGCVYCDAHDTTAWRDAMQLMLDGAERQDRSQQGLIWASRFRAPEGWRQHVMDIENIVQKG